MSDEALKPVTNQERAAIFEAAWRSYCVTNSTEYALSKAVEAGRTIGIGPFRASEIGRDACFTVQQEQRALNKTLLNETDWFVKRYLSRFANPRQ